MQREQFEQLAIELANLVMSKSTSGHLKRCRAIAKKMRSMLEIHPEVYVPTEPQDRPQHEPVEVHIRWMIRRDMPTVLDIEDSSFEFPWPKEDFIRALAQRNSIGMVAEYDEKVVGFMIYELHKNRLHVLNFAVNPEFRRRGVGDQMVRKLISKLNPDRRRSISLEVNEKNLAAQLFFRAVGFRAVSVMQDYYNDTTADAYLMQYRA